MEVEEEGSTEIDVDGHGSAESEANMEPSELSGKLVQLKVRVVTTVPEIAASISSEGRDKKLLTVGRGMTRNKRKAKLERRQA